MGPSGPRVGAVRWRGGGLPLVVVVILGSVTGPSSARGAVGGAGRGAPAGGRGPAGRDGVRRRYRGGGGGGGGLTDSDGPGPRWVSDGPGPRTLRSLWSWCFIMQGAGPRSEEHTSELQSRGHPVCRTLR